MSRATATLAPVTELRVLGEHWARVGEAAYLHLMGRDDEAAAHVRALDGIRAGLAAEWVHQLDTVASVVLASRTGDAPAVRRRAAHRIASERGLATRNSVHAALCELGILAALSSEPERAETLLRHSTGPHSYIPRSSTGSTSRLDGWPDVEFDDRRRAHLSAADRPGALTAATEALDEELARLLEEIPPVT